MIVIVITSDTAENMAKGNIGKKYYQHNKEKLKKKIQDQYIGLVQSIYLFFYCTSFCFYVCFQGPLWIIPLRVVFQYSVWGALRWW